MKPTKSNNFRKWFIAQNLVFRVEFNPINGIVGAEHHVNMKIWEIQFVSSALENLAVVQLVSEMRRDLM